MPRAPAGSDRNVTRYAAVVDGKPGAFGLWVPDMPGCTSAGDTVADVIRNAQEAMQLWALDAIEDGEAIPAPRSLEEIALDEEVRSALREDGAILVMVPLLLDLGQPVKANLSIDGWLLAAIDDAAKARGLTRSAFLANAAREKIEAEG